MVRAAARPTRFDQRREQGEATRLFMVENDLDEHDRIFELLISKTDRQTSIMIGILVTFTGAVLAGVANLIFNAV